MSQKSKHAPSEPESGASEAVTAVEWDGSAMVTSYANVLNVINTREEFSLFFGMNHTVDATEAGRLTVKLANRIVMTPHAAKRLSMLIAGRVAEYESKFGTLNVTGPQ